jgi:response regulator RpfG family c-di-GMP phosphodiesterase
MARGTGRTLLYIDPDPATQQLVRTVLAPEGFLVNGARSAIEGHESVVRLRPDLVLVDIDAVKVAEVVPGLRQSPGLEQVRLVAATACAGAEHLEKMLAWGFDRVLLKPVDIDTLADELASALPLIDAVSAPALSVPSIAPLEGIGSDGDQHVSPDAPRPPTVEAVPPIDMLAEELASVLPFTDTVLAPALPSQSSTLLERIGTDADEHVCLDALPLPVKEAVPPIDVLADELASVPPLVEAVSAPALSAPSTDGVGPTGDEHAWADAAPAATAGAAAHIDDAVASDERQDDRDPLAPMVDADLIVASPLTAAAPATHLDIDQASLHAAIELSATQDPPLPPVEVPSLWRLSLTPGLAALVSATGATEGVLALVDDEMRALVITAIAPHRRAGSTPLDTSTALGTRVRTSAVPWVGPTLERRESNVLGDIPPSPLVPAGSQTFLIVPVASPDRVHGVAILVRRRGPKAPPFSVGQVARGATQASRIAAIVRTLEDLDQAIGQKRRELAQLRLESVRSVLSDMLPDGKPARRSGASRTAPDSARDAGERARIAQFALVLAERFAVPPRRREVLRQAIEVHDVGQIWLDDVLIPRASLAALAREAMPDGYARHGAEILASLEWPPAVVELVRLHQAWWNGEGQPLGLGGTRIPIEARIMAVVTAFAHLLSATLPEGTSVVESALVELAREAGQRFDPAMVEAFAEVVHADADADLSGVHHG